MDEIIADTEINDLILYLLYHLKIRPSDFIKAYRENDCCVCKTVSKFKNTPRIIDILNIKNSFNKYKKTEDILFIKKKLEKTGADIVNIGNKHYPPLLKQIYFPPPVLFFKGFKIMQENNYIAVVGTRKNTAYGKDAAIYISSELSKAGITVVSGMAAGIDYWAHKAALKHKGGTVGVLGCGINIIYPPENKNLFEEITENGSIATEFIPGTPPLRNNFPARNRIISGFSMGVIVIEAPQKSGALITAEFALEQNREVFALPGNIFSSESMGCHTLIKNGAKLIHDVDDILCEITQFYSGKNSLIIKNPSIDNKNGKYNSKTGRIKENKRNEKNIKFSEPDKNMVYEIIGFKPKTIEEIIVLSGLKTPRVMQIISELELDNMIYQKSLNQFIRL
ncbi:MAG: DNA-processing protein DprA [Actinobacteria bacterium]|nr:DNA-processing protein DprA [Actinomycetota bacterium]